MGVSSGSFIGRLWFLKGVIWVSYERLIGGFMGIIGSFSHGNPMGLTWAFYRGVMILIGVIWVYMGVSLL